MKKIDKKNLKAPDKFQKELQKGFVWTTQHSQIVGVSILAFLVLGAGLSAKSYLDQKNEREIQAKYFQIEKKYLDLKKDFEAAGAAKPPADTKAEAKKSQAEKTAQTDGKPAPAKATGDLEKDYGSVAADFMKIINEAPKSKAAKMAALNLAEIEIQYNKFPEAQDTLKKVTSDSRDLLSGLVALQLGSVQADLNDCNSALATWNKVLANSEAQALHASVKLKSGVCYETLKDFGKAEKLYTEAKAEDKDSTIARTADKYLRTLQTVKKD